MTEPCVFELAKAFDAEFVDFNTKLSPGAQEPFYKAAANGQSAIIYSNQDFFSSALHEIAHWCIAGENRRVKDDYGYWYAPDGRTEAQQADFFQVEIKPQALEWAFHLATQLPFEFSLDNLNNKVCEKQIESFKQNVNSQLTNYFEQGFPARALRVIQLLAKNYNGHQPIQLPTSKK